MEVDFQVSTSIFAVDAMKKILETHLKTQKIFPEKRKLINPSLMYRSHGHLDSGFQFPKTSINVFYATHEVKSGPQYIP